MDFDSKSELDFNNRLIAKFRLGPRRQFWRDGFRPYSKAVLYPKNDRIQDLCEDLEADLRTDASAGRVGEFLLQWVSLESRLLEVARSLAPERRTYSMLQALELLQARDTMGPELLEALHNLRRSRNTIVHFPERAGATKVSEATSKARMLQDKIRSAPPWDM